MRPALLLLALMFTFTAPCRAADAASTYTTNKAFTVTLTDGSTIFCHPQIKKVPVKTPYAELVVPLERISVISNSVAKAESVIAMKNGDVVRGECSIKELTVVCLVGKLTIPMKNITEINARMKPKRVFEDSPARKNACINHLRMIDSAKEQWALANRRAEGDQAVVNQVNEYLRGNRTPVCPANGKYTYHPIGRNPTCDCPGHKMPGGF